MWIYLDGLQSAIQFYFSRAVLLVVLEAQILFIFFVYLLSFANLQYHYHLRLKYIPHYSFLSCIFTKPNKKFRIYQAILILDPTDEGPSTQCILSHQNLMTTPSRFQFPTVHIEHQCISIYNRYPFRFWLSLRLYPFGPFPVSLFRSRQLSLLSEPGADVNTYEVYFSAGLLLVHYHYLCYAPHFVGLV